MDLSATGNNAILIFLAHTSGILFHEPGNF